MEIKEGFSYHIKNNFYIKVSDEKLMRNKENGNYRPHYFAIRDKCNNNLLWLIPISSKFLKYSNIYKSKIKKYGKCDTIVLGYF